MVFKLFKLLVLVAVLAFAGLVAYAYFGDLSPDSQERTVPVTLDDA